jgi:hypothetical protein
MKPGTPYGGNHHGGKHDGHNNKRQQNPAPTERAVEKQGQKQSPQNFRGGGNQRKHNGVANARKEKAVFQDTKKIQKTDKTLGVGRVIVSKKRKIGDLKQRIDGQSKNN